jgi:hypothetical protein
LSNLITPSSPPRYEGLYFMLKCRTMPAFGVPNDVRIAAV